MFHHISFLKAIDKQLAESKEESQKLDARWQNQQKVLEELGSIREEIDALKAKLEEAERQVQLDEAAKIKYGELPKKQQQLAELEDKWSKIPSEEKLIKEVVSEDSLWHTMCHRERKWIE